MPATVIDVDQAMIDAQARVEEWEQEFQDNFFAPMQMAQAVMMFAALPPEVLARMRAEEPETFALLNRHVQRLKGLVSNGEQSQGQADDLPADIPRYPQARGY